MKSRSWLVLIPAAGLRLVGLGGQSFWTDEAISWETTTWTWSQFWAFVRVDPHPPLFYLTLRAWRWIGFDGEFGLRLFSALAGIATVAVVVALLRRTHGERAATVGGLLAAVNPQLVWVSQELRGMALAGLFVALSAWGWQRARDGEKRRALLAAASLLAACYTHYFALFLLPAAVLADRTTRRIGFLTLAGFAPWLPVMWSQAHANLDFRAVQPLWREIVETLLYANAGHFPWRWPMWTGLLDGLFAEHFYWYLACALLLVVPIIVLAASRTKLFLCYGGPLVLAWLTSRFIPIFQPKYLAVFLPMLAVAAGAGFVALAERRARLAGALLTAALFVPFWSLADLYFNPVYQKPPWRDALPRLTASLGNDDRVVFYASTDAKEVRYYLNKTLQHIDLFDDSSEAINPSDEQLRFALARLTDPAVDRLCLVDLNGALYGRTRQIILETLAERRGPPDEYELTPPSMNIRWLYFN
jgi:4-amino-4-deoxy-L-arabinose transferase-like glycosyltransferase